VVFDHGSPYRGIEVRGRHASKRPGDARRRFAVRDLRPDDACERAGDDTLIRLAPGRFRAQDFADEL